MNIGKSTRLTIAAVAVVTVGVIVASSFWYGRKHRQSIRNATQGRLGSKGAQSAPNLTARTGMPSPAAQGLASTVQKQPATIESQRAPSALTQIAPPESAATPHALASVTHAEPNCFTLSFHRKPTPGEDDSGDHKNLIHLDQAGVNAKSLCVRADGTPVAFQLLRSGDILIGSLSGPQTKITASFCIGKANCTESCVVPAAKKDEFMEAIGGDDGDGKNLQGAGQWEADGAQGKGAADVTAHLGKEMKTELAALDEVDENGNALPIFKGWIGETEASSVCQRVRR